MLFFLSILIAICSSTENAIEAEEQSGGCSICQLVVSYIEAYVQQNATEQEIIQKLDQLCSNIPIFGKECDSVVSNYAPQIIQWILNKENPQAFCSTVRLCSSPKKLKEKTMLKVKAKGTAGCSICRLVAGYVDRWVSENATEEAITLRLEAFCTVLGKLQSECQSIVATYTPRLINWVVSRENPTAFCDQVQLCTSKKVIQGHVFNHVKREEVEENEVDLINAEEESIGCQLCQLITTYVEQLVANNNTISEIITKVDELCGLLGPSLSPLCDQIAAKYVPSLVQWILKKENPQAFCAQVRLC